MEGDYCEAAVLLTTSLHRGKVAPVLNLAPFYNMHKGTEVQFHTFLTIFNGYE
jgi:hypothetical protein